jgi:hypothetical protein
MLAGEMLPQSANTFTTGLHPEAGKGQSLLAFLLIQ